jgi:hypothetical protein
MRPRVDIKKPANIIYKSKSTKNPTGSSPSAQKLLFRSKTLRSVKLNDLQQRKRKTTSGRAIFSEKKMQKAIELVQVKGHSCYYAANKLNVPASTLYLHLKSNGTLKNGQNDDDQDEDESADDSEIEMDAEEETKEETEAPVIKKRVRSTCQKVALADARAAEPVRKFLLVARKSAAPYKVYLNSGKKSGDLVNKLETSGAQQVENGESSNGNQQLPQPQQPLTVVRSRKPADISVSKMNTFELVNSLIVAQKTNNYNNQPLPCINNGGNTEDSNFMDEFQSKSSDDLRIFANAIYGIAAPNLSGLFFYFSLIGQK